jgi:hypothetical protein
VSRRPWLPRHQFLSRIGNVVDDWLTPVEYLPYIDALLGDIDLDPCSTHLANDQFLRAKQIYTLKEDGLNTEIPWTGTTYLFPPTYGRCSFNKERGTWRWGLRGGGPLCKAPSAIWFNRLEKEWKMRNIREALFFSTNHETMRTNLSIWNYPVCIPEKRCNLIHGKTLTTIAGPFTWGYFVYLPRAELGFNQADKFIEIFSHLGKVIY